MENIELIKQLREETGVSLGQCKKAIEESGGDLEKAKEILRKWGEDLAGKKSSRSTNEGIIESYIHANGKIGVLVVLKCETDFVARNPEFKELAHNLALHIAAAAPEYLSEEDIPEEVIEKEKNLYREQFKNSGKPDEIIEKIIQGKLETFKKEKVLLNQPYIKDDSKTIRELLNQYISKLGENITIEKFVRLEI
ncbi:elongation factor Ts [bacterium]|nr:elongation factor Ts [bacterium]